MGQTKMEQRAAGERPWEPDDLPEVAAPCLPEGDAKGEVVNSQEHEYMGQTKMGQDDPATPSFDEKTGEFKMAAPDLESDEDPFTGMPLSSVAGLNAKTVGTLPVEGPKFTKAPAVAGCAQVQEQVDKEGELGWRGFETDPTPDSHYTVAGVTAGKPTPETDAGARLAALGAQIGSTENNRTHRDVIAAREAGSDV